MQEKIIKEVARLCKVAGISFIEPTFTLKGKVAGTFSYKSETCSLNFNLIFAENHPSEYMARTVIHEVAHYVRYARNGYSHDMNGNKRDCHGAKWHAVMQELGAVDVKRCHSYDTSLIPTRTYKRFEYSCDSGHTYQLTSIRHNRSQKWGDAKWYTCNECSSQLHFRG